MGNNPFYPSNSRELDKVFADIISELRTQYVLGFYPRGQFFVGTLVITAFVFSDMLDGAVARVTGSSGRWGAFLDSTLDRVGDGAIFGSLALWLASQRSASRMTSSVGRLASSIRARYRTRSSGSLTTSSKAASGWPAIFGDVSGGRPW